MCLKYEVVYFKDCVALKFLRHGVRHRKNGPAIMWYNLYKNQGYYEYYGYVSEI